MEKQTGENALARILNDSPAQLEYVLKQKARAQEVLDAWLADSDELAHETDDEYDLRLNAVIAKNLDVESIHHFINIIRRLGGAVLTALARKGAQAKLARDPKQKDKERVLECWKAWKKTPLDRDGKPKYKGKEAFAKDMLKFESLESTQVITRWCRKWEKEHVT